MEARLGETHQETLDRLRHEADGLRASRERLVLAADADRREIERALHDGVHQQLIALAVNLQLASELAATDPAEAQALLGAMGRDVQVALDQVAMLAERIHPPLLEAAGLGAALRAAAARAGASASIDVRASGSCAPEIVATVYRCCLGAFGHDGASITVRDSEGALAFSVAAEGAWLAAGADGLRDRVEALGGELTIASEPGGRTRVVGTLPLAR